MADQLIKVGGAWKSIDDCKVKVSGAWKDVDNIYVKVSGAWKAVWEALLFTLSAETENQVDAVAPYNSTVSIRVATDGGIYTASEPNGGALSYSLSQSWLVPGTDAGDYECRVTSVNHNAGVDAGSGWSSSPGADGTWFALTSNRQWNTTETAAGDYDTTATMEIRHATDLNEVTATFTWSIVNTS